MFTGIVKETGIVRSVDAARNMYRLSVSSEKISKSADIGDSVAVNGVCLTVVEKGKGRLSFDVMEETVRKTDLTGLKKGGVVNLEDSLRPDGYIGGHFVLGHIDCVGSINSVNARGNGYMMDIGFPEGFASLVVEKGSAAIDGVSLTVGEVTDRSFTVHLIPHTLNTTNLGLKKARDKVNIEFDIIGKYISRLKDIKAASRISEEFLKMKGF